MYIEGSSKKLAKAIGYIKKFNNIDELLDFAVKHTFHEPEQSKLIIIDYTDVNNLIGLNLFDYQNRIFSKGKVIKSDFIQEVSPSGMTEKFKFITGVNTPLDLDTVTHKTFTGIMETNEYVVRHKKNKLNKYTEKELNNHRKGKFNMKLIIREEFEDDYHAEGYYTEEYSDYLECQITLTLATFAENISRIREYIIEEVLHSRDYNKISLHNYKLFERNNELVDIDGEPYEFDGQSVVDLVVRFSVDVNSEYDFNEYGFEEAIRKIRRYLLY